MRWTFLAVFLLSFFVNVLRLTIPIYMMQVMDRVVRSHHLDTLFYLTAIAGVSLLVGAMLVSLRSMALSRLGLEIEQSLLPSVIRSGFEDRPQDGLPPGQELRDLSAVRQYIGSPGLVTLFDAPWVPALLLVIYVLHPTVGIVAVTAAIVLVVLAVLNHAVVAGRHREANQSQMKLMQRIESALGSRPIVFALDLMPAILSRLSQMSSDGRQNGIVASDRGAILGSLSQFLRQLTQILTLGVAASLVIKGEVTAGVMMASSILLSFALAPVDQAIGSWRSTVGALECWGRLRAQLALVNRRGEMLPAAEASAKAGLQVNKVVLVPPGVGRPIIRQVNFTVQPGETLGVLGPTAAGKSVLCQLLVGALVPTGGNVLFDQTDMHRRQAGDVGYIGQEPMLLHATVAENIARLSAPKDEETQRMLVAAARSVDLETCIQSLPDGYNTYVSDRSALLSRGERQKVALARAFYGHPRLLVLDDPTAFLDRAGEQRVVETLADLKRAGVTMIIVSQSSRVLELCDRAMLLRSGMLDMLDETETVLARAKAQRKSSGAERTPPTLEAIPGGLSDVKKG